MEESDAERLGRLAKWFPEVAEHEEKIELNTLEELQSQIHTCVIEVDYANSLRPKSPLDDKLDFPTEYKILDDWVVYYQPHEDSDMVFVAGYLEGQPFENGDGDTCVNARAVMWEDEQEGTTKLLKSKGITVEGFLNAPDWGFMRRQQLELSKPDPQRTLKDYPPHQNA